MLIITIHFIPAIEHQMIRNGNEAEKYVQFRKTKMYCKSDVAWFCCLRTSRELISLAFSISMLLSMLICRYFLFLPSSRNEFWRREGISSKLISGLFSWCSRLRPQFGLLRLRLNVDMAIGIMRVTIMWKYFMANRRGKGWCWGLARLEYECIAPLHLWSFNGEILMEWHGCLLNQLLISNLTIQTQTSGRVYQYMM